EAIQACQICFMIPFNVPDAPPLTYGDRFDVPVLLRNGPAKKPRKQWRTAELKPWAGLGGFPATNGWYITTTTWREIIKAAVEVGRDVTPHLQNQPQYAHGELVARVSPLYAYLGMHSVTSQHPVPGTTGRRLTLNPVYAYGTERSAKNAAAYRLGMTMTEWACRSLLGLGQTQHLELGGPIDALSGTFKDPKIGPRSDARLPGTALRSRRTTAHRARLRRPLIPSSALRADHAPGERRPHPARARRSSRSSGSHRAPHPACPDPLHGPRRLPHLPYPRNRGSSRHVPEAVRRLRAPPRGRSRHSSADPGAARRGP